MMAAVGFNGRAPTAAGSHVRSDRSLLAADPGIHSSQSGLGRPNRSTAGLWRIAGVHFAAGTGLGRACRRRGADLSRPDQFLADLGCGVDRCGAWRLAVLLDRAQARAHRTERLAAVAPSGADPEG